MTSPSEAFLNPDPMSDLASGSGETPSSHSAYKVDDRFETANGTLYVSKPYRSGTSKKLRALISFVPRNSAFDMNNESSKRNEFRGFFTLFWMSLFIFTLQSYVRSIEAHGRPLNLRFATTFSQDAIILALSDGVLVLCTGICVLFAKGLKNGWLQHYWAGVIIQHLLQTTILFGAISWTFNRNWPWVQSGFLTLHSLVMVMKMHSYMTVNGQLQHIDNEGKSVFDQLKSATEFVGGWDEAIEVASAKQAEQQAKITIALETADDSNTEMEPTPIGTPAMPEGLSTSYLDAKTANALRKRLAAISRARSSGTSSSTTLNAESYRPPPGPGNFSHFNDSLKNENKLQSNDTTELHRYVLEGDDQDEAHLKPHVLVYHPDEKISALANEYSDLQSELVSSGPNHVKWQDAITWKNFALYQLTPTLVYELEYPRTDRIRPLYVFEKTVATFGTFALLYTVTESFILPYTSSPNQSFFRLLLDLAMPFMMANLLIFYIIFECICNGFAELSCFADRQFYEDWWNSTSWDEFARKWNKPVYTFLLRHVYSATRKSYRISRSGAMFVTFLVSALAHELVMVIVTKKIRMYLFTLQLIQIPLIMLGRIPAIRRNKILGNIVFWIGIYAGLPLLCVAYVAY